jgi:hypothetical protein
VIESVLQNVGVEFACVNGHQLGAGRFGRGQEFFEVGITVRVPVNGRGGIGGAGMAVKNDDAVCFEVALDFCEKGVQI